MNKSLLIVCFAIMTALGGSEDRIDKFIAKFDNFVTQVLAMDNDQLHGEKLQSIEAKYETYIKEYNDHFSQKMTTEQLTQFNRIRGKYQKKILTAKTKRKGAEAKGFIEGLVGNSEK
ncbi:MAG: hypothetical protein MJZ67_05595 [Bacteroidales bacterium]|nr:hypothetical protein [Bacteroidales bacterium]